MLLLRVAAILVLIAIGASMLLYLWKRDRRYLRLAWNLFRFAVVFALVFFALLILERVLAF